MNRKSLSGLILLGVFTAGVASSSAVSAAGEPSTFASGNIEITEESAEKELSEQIEGENSGDKSTVDGSEDIENETNLAEETIKEDGSNNTEPKDYVYIDDKTKEQQAPAKGGKGSGVSLAKGMIGAGVAALGTSGAAAGIKVGLSKGDPEPDNPQPEPGKEEEEPKEEEPKEEEKPNGLSAGAIAGIAVGGVIVVVSCLIYFRLKKSKNAPTTNVVNEENEENEKNKLKSKLLEVYVFKMGTEKKARVVDNFVSDLNLGAIQQLENKISKGGDFATLLVELMCACSSDVNRLAKLVNWCGAEKLATLMQKCNRKVTKLVMWFDTEKLAVLVNECDVEKLVKLVNECDAEKLVKLVECSAKKLVKLVNECNAINLAELVDCKEFNAKTFAEKLNNDNRDDNFVKQLVTKLEGENNKFNEKDVCNWISEYTQSFTLVLNQLNYD